VGFDHHTGIAELVLADAFAHDVAAFEQDLERIAGLHILRATGNVHRAVGQDFILNVGDILYFAGTAENFGEFCEEHGLEVITNEVKESLVEVNTTEISANQDVGEAAEALSALVGTTKRSLSLFDDDEKIRVINKMRGNKFSLALLLNEIFVH